jgi:hypothetical protein
MSMMEKMMEFMMGRMSKEEKDAMMNQMMDKFFADMTSEDKKKMMAEMMPKMMEGVNMMEMMPQMMMSMMGGESENGMMGMMSKMMGGGKEMQMPMMPQMMMEMMPQCLSIMLPHIPKDDRIAFVLTMVTTLMEKGSDGFAKEERMEFLGKIADIIKTLQTKER